MAEPKGGQRPFGLPLRTLHSPSTLGASFSNRKLSEGGKDIQGLSFLDLQQSGMEIVQQVRQNFDEEFSRGMQHMHQVHLEHHMETRGELLLMQKTGNETRGELLRIQETEQGILKAIQHMASAMQQTERGMLRAMEKLALQARVDTQVDIDGQTNEGISKEGNQGYFASGSNFGSNDERACSAAIRLNFGEDTTSPQIIAPVASPETTSEFSESAELKAKVEKDTFMLGKAQLDLDAGADINQDGDLVKTISAAARGMGQIIMGDPHLEDHLEQHEGPKGHLHKRRGTTFFDNTLQRKTHQVTCWMKLLLKLGISRHQLKQPDTWLVKKVNGSTFNVFCSLVTVINSLVIGIETDAAMWCALKNPPCTTSVIFGYFDWGFSIFFGLELLVRICANRLWFLASPAAWRWNMLDVFLVGSCIFTHINEAIGQKSSNVTFLRLLRVFRIVRVARIIRVVRFFKEMRKMMFSVMGSMVSLSWSLVFLCMIMFMFSIFFMQGATHHIQDTNYDDTVREGFARWYGSLYESMFSLLAAILGGADWMDILKPLRQVSEVYSIAFAFYIVFVVVGVLNILTGVFLDSAKDFKDRDLIVQQEYTRMDNFIAEMLELFHEFDPHGTGMVSREHFDSYIALEHVQAYLASHTLDTTHADMLYHLLDQDNIGEIDIHDFILGLLRLKGSAKELDTRVLLHEVRTVKTLLQDVIATGGPPGFLKQITGKISNSGEDSQIQEGKTL